MSSSRDEVRGGKLKLKGNRSLFKADKPKKKRAGQGAIVDEDQVAHGGWRRIEDDLSIKGGIDVVIECGGDDSATGLYLSALDNGKFVVGAKKFHGEQPDPQSVLTIIRSPDDTKISLRTGYGRYVGVNSAGELVAIADAIGPRERFEIIFQDGKSGIQSASSGLFLSMPPNDEGNISVCSKVVKSNEIINMRTTAVCTTGPADFRSAEDKMVAGDCETSYDKIYQHSKVDIKNRMVSFDPTNKSAVKWAQMEGNLHETLLERRVKKKSDKYC